MKHNLSTEKKLSLSTINAAFMAEGLRDNDYQQVLASYSEGGIELIQELTKYIPYLLDLIEMAETVVIDNYPGVFEYEVTSCFGKWFGEEILRTKHTPSTEDCRQWLFVETLNFFSQELDENLKPALRQRLADLKSHELSPFKTLYTRPDGQVFGISYTGYGEYQSVVPSDLAEAGAGYQHMSESGAESYLWELIYKEINVDKRFEEAINNAEEAFWAEIAKAYPEIKSGDLGPDIVIPFKTMMEKAVAAWLTLNAPEGVEIVNLVHSNLTKREEDVSELGVS